MDNYQLYIIIYHLGEAVAFKMLRLFAFRGPLSIFAFFLQKKHLRNKFKVIEC